MSYNKIKTNYGRNFLYLHRLYSFFIKKKRLEIYKIFKKETKPNKTIKLLDVGTTSSLESHENILLNKFKWKSNIYCLSNLNLKKLKQKYPLAKFYQGDGRQMFFKNNQFNIVFSSATIEHVGSLKNQIKFIKECYRVSNRFIFITTPNRNYPIEFHTRLPLLHLLPNKIFRKILKLFGENFLSQEEQLNLLSEKDLIKICNKLKIKNFKILKIKLFYLVSNLILIIYKK